MSDETHGREFYIQHGSGQLLVLTDGLDVHETAELARSHTGGENGKRLREWSYQPNDAVTVAGRATEVSRAEYPEPVVVGLDGSVLVGVQRQEADLKGRAAQRTLLGSVLVVGVGGSAFVVMLLTV